MSHSVALENSTQIQPSTQPSYFGKTNPLGFAINVVLNVCAFLHLLIPRISPFLKIQGFQNYSSIKNPSKEIQSCKAKIEKIAKKMGLTRDITLMIKEGDFCLGAQGVGGIPFTSPVVAIGTNFIYHLEEKQLEFVLAHELAHVESYDSLKLGGLLVLISAISLLAVNIFIVLAIRIAGLIVLSLFSKHIEKNADLRAVEVLKDPSGALAFFEKIPEHFDLLHPTPRQRIAAIRAKAEGMALPEAVVHAK